MFILAGAVLIVFGLTQILLKDLWWMDMVLLGQVLGKPIQRTVQWERQQDRVGAVCGVAGLIFLAVEFVLSAFV